MSFALSDFPHLPRWQLPTERLRVSKWLTRKEAAEYLRDRIKVGSVSLLSKLAKTGEGPRFYSSGKATLYSPSDLDAWVEGRLRANVSPPAAENYPASPTPDPVAEAFAVLRNLGLSA